MPMANLHLAFDTCVPNLPKGHVLLLQSKYSFSFIDISQIWESLKENRRETNESQIEKEAQPNNLQKVSSIIVLSVITCLFDW